MTRGRKLRVDTTAVETEIHSPTDSGPIGDGVRVVSRPLERARAVLGEAASGPSSRIWRSRASENDDGPKAVPTTTAVAGQRARRSPQPASASAMRDAATAMRDGGLIRRAGPKTDRVRSQIGRQVHRPLQFSRLPALLDGQLVHDGRGANREGTLIEHAESRFTIGVDK